MMPFLRYSDERKCITSWLIMTAIYQKKNVTGIFASKQMHITYVYGKLPPNYYYRKCTT